MSYSGISVKDAMDNINSDNNGWFLPYAQRPYVWGSRHENEQYICKLFDSILRGYPIGGLIVWNAKSEIPYREFMREYKTGNDPELVEKGLHGKKDKWLVYDGQQRLQTLYCCLKYTFNEKILVYDLYFDLSASQDPEETGFHFKDKNSDLAPNYLRMNELFSKMVDEESDYEDEIMLKIGATDELKRKAVKKNLKALWKVYVERDKNSLAYYEIKSPKEEEVNEIFERLNSGGVSLSLSDLLFTHIKKHNEQYDFEEKLQQTKKIIYKRTAGYTFDAYSILQLLYLLVKGRVRVDPKSVSDKDLDKFSSVWSNLEEPMLSFFSDYLWEKFTINNSSIIPRKLALLPIMVYFYEIYNKGYSFKNITETAMRNIDQYFIKSQINDWNMQSYIDNFTEIILNASKTSGEKLFDFPIREIEDKINEKRQRNVDLSEEGFISYRWFSLKVLMPNRMYQFEPDKKGRFNPEIDHIFPLKLKGQDDKYRQTVDVLWNLQPVKGESNGYKLNHHPRLFFSDKIKDRKGAVITGSKYLFDYDFLPAETAGSATDLTDPIWDNPFKFVETRKKLMADYMERRYDLKFS